jgi:iron complex outermembrane recepter protein
MIQIKRKRLPAALMSALGASVLLAATGVHAQQAQRVEKIEVTGTNIKRTDTETPSVVQVITREQIERSGATSVAELLREVPAIAGGSATDFDPGTGFQRGNQTASLRGLGSVATLVLLNGRRIAPAPYADPNLGQGSSFNLNTIPLSAIERIDVLKDGASAIYGSDAIAGVINIILRKDYRGAEISWSHFQKLDHLSDRMYQTEQLSGAVGFGDLTRDRYNFLLAAEYTKREGQRLQESGSGVRNEDYLRLANRGARASELAFPANLRRESAPGVFGTAGRLPGDPNCPGHFRTPVATGANNAAGPFVCTWNSFDALDIVAPVERGGLMGRLTYQLTGNTSAFAEASFTRNTVEFVGNPPSLNGSAATTWFNRAGQRFSYQLILPVGHPDNPNPFRVALLYRFADLGNTRTEVETDSSRVVAGLNGAFGAWDWESAILWGQTKRTETSNGILYAPALISAVNSGTYRFSGHGTNSQALLDSLHPDFTNVGESTITQWDIKGSREVWNMRNGPVMLAAGFELRKEEMEIVSDPRTVAGEFLGVASSTVNASRNIWSIFGELSVPILKNLEMQLAARHDHYSDFGDSTTPKVGFKWNVTNALAARATYAMGFRAPSLFQIATGDVQAFNAGIVDPLRCPGGVRAPGSEPEDCNRSISTLIRANPNLQPEESTSNTVGIIWAPSSNASVSVDRWYVHRTNFIDRYNSVFVIQQNFLGNPEFADAVIRDPNPASFLPGIPNSGPIQSTIRRFDNFGGTVVRGWDLDGSWKLPVGAWGRLGLEAHATYYDKLLWKIGKDVPYISGLGNFYIFEAPRFRGQATATWDYRAFSFLTRYNYTGSWYYGEPTQVTSGVTSSGPLQCYLSSTSATIAFLGRCYVEANETWDVGVSWTGIKNLKVGLLVRNVTNKAAPYDPNQITQGFNPTFANPYGRYLQFSIGYKFR